MSHKRCFRFFIAAGLSIFFTQALQANGVDLLNPSVPAIVITSTNATMPTTVTATSSGFITAAIRSGHIDTNFSANSGTTWSSPSTLSASTSYPAWIANNTQGAMLCWTASNRPYWSFSTDNGTTWSAPAQLNNNSNIASPVTVSANNAGFVATWKNSSNDAYASFTTTNGTTWSSPVKISDSAIPVNTSVIVAASSDGFMAVWSGTNNSHTGYAYSSYSNNGTTWSSPTNITTNVLSDVWVAGNSTGFMTTWANNNNSGCSSFSADGGQTWSSPATICNENVLYSGDASNVSVTAAETGFVSAWIGFDYNAYGSFSYGANSSWSTIKQITSDGSISGATGNMRPFIGTGSTGDECMFVWLKNDGNTYSSSSRMGSLRTPSGFAGIQLKNNFGLVYELFNQLVWQPSTSTGVAGHFLYRNSLLIATLGALTANYEDHNQEQNAATLYSVQAFDANGHTSPSSHIRFTNGVARTVTPSS